MATRRTLAQSHVSVCKGSRDLECVGHHPREEEDVRRGTLKGFCLQRVDKGPCSFGWAMNCTQGGETPQGRKEPPEGGSSDSSQCSHREGKSYAPNTENGESLRSEGHWAES